MLVLFQNYHMRLLSTLAFCLCLYLAFGQTIISGNVIDIKSKLPLSDVKLVRLQGEGGVYSDSLGHFSYYSKDSVARFRLVHVYYKDTVVLLTAGRTNNIYLSPLFQEVDGINIVDKKGNPIEDNYGEVYSIDLEVANKIPYIFGEKDILKVVKLMPGVSSVSGLSGGISVRGGSSDQNLFLLDNVSVYSVKHLMGIVSVFNADALENVNVYTGGFPSRYGGRVSSVLDFEMKEGDYNNYKVNGSIGLISSRLTVEGPLTKRKNTSFLFSARRSYLDLFTTPIQKIRNKKSEYNNEIIAYNMYDLNFKLAHKINAKSKFYLGGYSGRDNFSFTQDTTKNEGFEFSGPDEFGMKSYSESNFKWGNDILYGGYEYIFNPAIQTRVTLSYTKFMSRLREDNYQKLSDSLGDLVTEERSVYDLDLHIKDLSLKNDWFWTKNKHSLRWGGGLSRLNFLPGKVNEYRYFGSSSEVSEKDTVYQSPNYINHEVNAYVEHEWKFLPRFKLNYGAYLSSYITANEVYINPQPRALIQFNLNEKQSLSASYSRMVQNAHSITSNSAMDIYDIWVPVTDVVKPITSDQVSLAFQWELNKGFNFKVGAYHKHLENVLYFDAEEVTSLTSSNWENEVVVGEGWSKGLELFVEKRTGKLTGWLAYTLSKSDRRYEGVNMGKTFPFKYDRRHDLNVVLNYKFNKKWDVGMVFVLATGNAITMSTHTYQDFNGTFFSDESNQYTGGKQEYQSGVNNFRLPMYQRVDFAVNRRKQKKHGVSTWSFSVYNSLNHFNPLLANKSVGMNKEYMVDMSSMFPLIPAVSWSFDFTFKKQQ